MRIILFVISTTLFSTIDAKFKKKVTKTEYLVTHAHKAKLGQFPFQVAITKFYIDPSCGGTLIDSRHVLTAAHCLYAYSALTDKNEFLNSTIVYLGMIQLNSTSKIAINSSKLFFMEGVLEHKGTRDIAIIRLKAPVKFSKNVKPAKLKFRTYKPGTIGLVSGWGSTWTEDTPENEIDDALNPNDLMFAEAKIISNEECQAIINEIPRSPTKPPYVVGDDKICTMSVGETGAVCHGDSGGSLSVGGELIGVTHAVFSLDEKCQKQYPALYTRVSYYKKWINAVQSLYL